MSQGTYEAAMVRLRSLGVMRADIQRRLDEVQSQEWSRDGQGAQTLQQSIQDVDAASADLHRTIMAARAGQ